MTGPLRQRYPQVPADLLTFTKQILRENITSCSVRVKNTSLSLELLRKKKR